MFIPSATEIQMVGAAVEAGIALGKLVGNEIRTFVRFVLRKRYPEKTNEQVDAMVEATVADARFRELLARIEAGQIEPSPEALAELADLNPNPQQ